MGHSFSTMGVPTYSVRFETQDDFLVEYADRLRHGQALLPLAKPLPPGTPVRLKVELPDRRVLYLLGSVIAPARRGQSDGATQVRLALTDEQRSVLESCVQGLTRADEPVPSIQLDDDLDRDPTGVSVLLVDDSVSMRIELGDALRERGLRVRVAENGLVALSAALKRPPDVILTDVEMPEMDGWTFVRTVRARPSLGQIPIVFLTRLSDDLSRLKGYRLGVDDYLPKTMPPEEIIARLQECSRGVVRWRCRPRPAEATAGCGDGWSTCAWAACWRSSSRSGAAVRCSSPAAETRARSTSTRARLRWWRGSGTSSTPTIACSRC